ncbi:hypothetical protein ACFQH9_02050 [Pseudonocardia lutea]|uniref:Uncharacterized protein n=1 Tax=Pseudonocardia lutea TaxID=2172015 RepID=A0ABW1I431_9PSEU
MSELAGKRVHLEVLDHDGHGYTPGAGTVVEANAGGLLLRDFELFQKGGMEWHLYLVPWHRLLAAHILDAE